MVKKAAIACAHPVTSILKLYLNHVFNLSIYHAIKEHVILLLHNLSPLLTLFMSLKIMLYDLISIV